ncbi:MAG: hypothetical protein H0X73_02855 [Chthoniobacterales bacterium]|nr:hypothetical protein [Chthoniobacterales bacterium]
MNEPVAPPPQRSRSGCFAKGCMTVVVLFLLLGVAFIGGGYWALRHLQNQYSATEPLTFGDVTSKESTLVQASKTEQAPTADGAISPPVPQEQQQTPSIASEPYTDVRARWRAFEKAGKRGDRARVELTANDINALIAGDPKLSGKAFVSIANNAARVQVSVPLNNVILMEGRYLNGEATVEASPDGDPRKARISSVIMSNQAVPESFSIDDCSAGHRSAA